ncbi:hypothetical protein, partial [Clostridium sp. E02]|uniref:hypothetical protein n=1 Tax=Clostridium sp. E02 TaxID=2487134 RepID=UPI0013DD9033
MGEINDKDASKLVSFIYGATINENMNKLKKSNHNKMSDLVKVIEISVTDLPPNQKLGGEMTKEEFLDVIDQVKDSDTLMRMEIKDFTNNDKTDFRA